ncbi:uncharacterized protein A4U43_C01F6510 [Asparagus officinalis]|uniref:Uncharacterized protein n=1 Tax=Asparagus officinalis TaxID=4686 RepID=A0A5P1FMV7_ASPOF|nr:uncharacterized protein A4U43_C01F6510 [Asparagus officinalis]
MTLPYLGVDSGRRKEEGGRGVDSGRLEEEGGRGRNHDIGVDGTNHAVDVIVESGRKEGGFDGGNLGRERSRVGGGFGDSSSRAGPH